MVSQHKGQCIRHKVKNKFILSFKKPIKKIWALLFIYNGNYQQLRFVSGSSPAKTCTLVFSACQISKNRAYATKSHRFLFLLRFVHSFRLRFIHNGGYQQLRFVSGSSPAKTCTLVFLNQFILQFVHKFNCGFIFRV